jgi:glycosyltransferase involved in cell wall biosynthesis
MIHDVVRRWRQSAVDASGLEIVVAADGGDEASLAAAAQVAGVEPNVKVVAQPDPPFNAVRGWNKAAAASTGKVLIVASDDFYPPPKWDHKLLSLPFPSWPDREFVIHVNDGYVRNLCTMPILTRRRYERLGYIYYPAYESVFCDTELTEKAKMDGVLINALHLTFEHKHPDCHKRQADEVDAVHNSSGRWSRGEMLFNFRKKRGFPTDDGPRASPPAKKTPKSYEAYAAYVQCVKDDFCLFEVCQRVAEEGVKNFFFCVPDEYWSGTVVPDSDKAEIAAIADKLRGLGVAVTVTPFATASFRAPERSRIMVETHLRNASLELIQRSGFKHVLILDGDELWMPGLLEKVDEVVRRGAPTAIGCRMVPVVGLPGYPINQAQDLITVYIKAGERFLNCRSPAGSTLILDINGVIHFTACRRTMAEIIRKHLDSGHGDDPEYDMVNWVKNVLPHVRPGMKNVHMYKKYQIWPEVRNWTLEELEHIPTSIWPYLGVEYVSPSPKPPQKALSHVRTLSRSPREFSTGAIHPSYQHAWKNF